MMGTSVCFALRQSRLVDEERVRLIYTLRFLSLDHAIEGGGTHVTSWTLMCAVALHHKLRVHYQGVCKMIMLKQEAPSEGMSTG